MIHPILATTILATISAGTGPGAPVAQDRPPAIVVPQSHLISPTDLSVTLDGNLADFAAIAERHESVPMPGAAAHGRDAWCDGPIPGEDGFQDCPLTDFATPYNRYMHSPINVGDAYVIYTPDSDGVIDPPSEDDSRLAIGINIANGDGDVFDTLCKLLTPPDLPEHIMVPFDSDGDGDPGRLGLGSQSRWFPMQPVIAFAEGFDSLTVYLYTCAHYPTQVGEADFKIVLLQTWSLPVDLYVEGLEPESIRTFPAVGTTCAEIAARGRDHVLYTDGRGNDDIELIVDRIDSQVALRFPGEDHRAIRHRLSNMVAAVSSAASGDRSEEDHLLVELARPLVGIEARALIRRQGGPDDWNTTIDVVQSSTVEVRLEFENTSSVPLRATVTDRLLVGPGLAASYVPGSFHATIIPAGDAEDILVTPQNAALFGLNPLFFVEAPAGFVHGILTGEARELGLLQPATFCISPPAAGDRVAVQFALQVDAVDEWCFDNGGQLRLNNVVSVEAVPADSAGNESVVDRFGRADTERESQSRSDDNRAAVVVSCGE